MPLIPCRMVNPGAERRAAATPRGTLRVERPADKPSLHPRSRPCPAQLRVDARDLDSVQAFVKALLAGTDFFSRREEPMTGFAPEGSEVREFAAELHGDLAEVIPTGVGGARTTPTSPFLRIRLSSEAAEEIKTAYLADAASRGGIGRGLRRWLDHAGLLPFAVFVSLFLLWPTILVVLGALVAFVWALSRKSQTEQTTIVTVTSTHVSPDAPPTPEPTLAVPSPVPSAEPSADASPQPAVTENVSPQPTPAPLPTAAARASRARAATRAAAPRRAPAAALPAR